MPGIGRDGIAGRLVGRALGNAVTQYHHTEADGAHGGTATSGSWLVLPFNDAADYDGAGLGSLSSSALTIGAADAGDWWVDAWHAFANLGGASTAIRLHDTDADSEVLAGSAFHLIGTDTYHQRLRGKVTLTAGMVLEMQYRTATTRATDGLGNLGTLTTTHELYGQWVMMRMSD